MQPAPASLQETPIYGGWVDSRGPRYCPSIEDKIVRFADKSSHQIFLEPESRSTPEVYVQVRRRGRWQASSGGISRVSSSSRCTARGHPGL